MGWLRSVRFQKKRAFAQLDDGSGGVPSDFNRDHQGADQNSALFGGGGGTWNSGLDESWDDDAILSTINFEGMLTNLAYSYKLGVRGRGAGVDVNVIDWAAGASCGGGKDFLAIDAGAFTLGGSAKLDGIPTRLSPLFLGRFSPVFRRFSAVPLRCPASWRRDGENGRKMAKNGRNLGEKRARNSGG